MAEQRVVGEDVSGMRTTTKVSLEEPCIGTDEKNRERPQAFSDCWVLFVGKQQPDLVGNLAHVDMVLGVANVKHLRLQQL